MPPQQPPAAAAPAATSSPACRMRLLCVCGQAVSSGCLHLIPVLLSFECGLSSGQSHKIVRPPPPPPRASRRCLPAPLHFLRISRPARPCCCAALVVILHAGSACVKRRGGACMRMCRQRMNGAGARTLMTMTLQAAWRVTCSVTEPSFFWLRVHRRRANQCRASARTHASMIRTRMLTRAPGAWSCAHERVHLLLLHQLQQPVCDAVVALQPPQQRLAGDLHRMHGPVVPVCSCGRACQQTSQCLHAHVQPVCHGQVRGEALWLRHVVVAAAHEQDAVARPDDPGSLHDAAARGNRRSCGFSESCAPLLVSCHH